MNPDHIITCVYCGMEYPENTPTHGSDIAVLTEHIKTCDKHPMRAITISFDKLIRELEHALEHLGDNPNAFYMSVEMAVKDAKHD